jgi:transposase-like protein
MTEKRTRRRFTTEFKAQAVKRLLEGGRGLSEVATELGTRTSTATRSSKKPGTTPMSGPARTRPATTGAVSYPTARTGPRTRPATSAPAAT